VVKVCGVTTPDDAAMAASLGADALGLNFWPRSKRAVTVAQARRIIEAVPPFVWVVGVFVNPKVAEVEEVARAVRLHMVQLHGEESPALVRRMPLPTVKALHVGKGSLDADAARYAGAHALLLDTAQAGWGGGGLAFDWRRARRVVKARPVLLAGGLTAENVGEAVALVRPLGVDVASGVEKRPGVKDEKKVMDFIRAARAAARGDD
jgi:phosphoribosylanthranilate isomerase